ncbi:hypothetical protein BJP36_39935 [Moorena producens JHB]|uniref:Uncharacterized protein n=1 Tax=Moorena producens (strain JHB) TaxID=1454205 RepID=A0A9Q9SS06_MOOP1|nr:hypothetical protein [Moorena producens]WAN68548.1 hypothetical protein BJP36_39935 [Moorena producens JHB]
MGKNSVYYENRYSRFHSFLLPIPDSRFPIPDSLLYLPCSLFPVPCSLI